MTTINLSQYQKLPFSCITPLSFVLYAVGALHLSRGLYKSTLFMQNKANLLNAQMNVNKVLTKGYENKRLRGSGENKAKQTQFIPTEGGTNPTCSELACTELVECVEPISKPAPLRAGSLHFVEISRPLVCSSIRLFKSSVEPT